MLTLVLAGVAAVAVGAMVGKFLYKKDDAWERQVEHMLELSAALTQYGLSDIPRALRLIAIRDFSGAYKIVRYWVEAMKRNPDAVMAEFDKVYEKIKAAKEAAAKKPKEEVSAPVTTK